MITIHKDAPEGNAFAIIGTAKNLMKQLDFHKHESEAVIHEMMSGDYEHLVSVFNETFRYLAEVVGNDEDDYLYY